MKWNKSDLQNILPHRAPMLFLDSAELFENHTVQAELCANPDWSIFQGHFPDYPVMPAACITEAMAQAAAVLLLTLPGQSGKYPMFLGISSMRFLRPVFPEDKMHLSASLSCDAGNDIYDCLVSVTVNGKKTASGKITLALRSLH